MKKRIALVIVLAVLLIGGGLVGRWVWQRVVGPGTHFDDESRVIFIPTGADLEAVLDTLLAGEVIDDERSFRWLADRKKYAAHVRPGRYRILRGTSLNALVNMLRAGEQEPVKLTFTNVDDLPELAGRLAYKLESDSLTYLKALSDPDEHRKAGLDAGAFISLFIPNTYEFWWTTTPEKFIARMRKEHNAFWSGKRDDRAKSMGYSRVQIATLASIVQAETVQLTDASKIAGVYLNRLRIGMPLQADPTLKFALNMAHVNRVLDRDKEVDSPYNTYRNLGLPPGPINMPEPRFIDAVLQSSKHDYLYFCAKADLSGYSDFSKNYEQHLVNARRYQRALNARKIYR